MLARGDDPDAVLEALASGLTGKFLHGPTALLQRHGSEQHRVSDLIARLLPETPSH
jgi:glutamyl-tRNA reductase